MYSNSWHVLNITLLHPRNVNKAYPTLYKTVWARDIRLLVNLKTAKYSYPYVLYCLIRVSCLRYVILKKILETLKLRILHVTLKMHCAIRSCVGNKVYIPSKDETYSYFNVQKLK